jgi:hypothetical protein
VNEPTEGFAPPLVQVAPVVRAGAGNLLPVEVRLTNTATSARAITVAALGVDPGWLPPPIVTPLLAPGQSTVVTLALQPAAGTLPASYPFAVTAQAVDLAGRPTGSPGVAESVLVVNPRAHVTLRLTRPHLTAIRSARIGVVLHNNGGAPALVRLAAQSGQGLRLSLPEGDIEVPAGHDVRVGGRVRLTSPRLVRYPTEHQYRVSALGAEAARYADGTVTGRGLFAPVWLKFAALLAIVSIWVGAAIVVIPAVGRHFGGNDTSATIAGNQSGSGDGATGGDDAGGADAGGSDGAGGAGGAGASGGAGGEAGGGSGHEAERAAQKNPEIQLNGTVAAENAKGVNVSLEPTSLVDEEAIGGIGVGVNQVALTAVGKRPSTLALLEDPGETPPRRGAVTGSDGAWSFPAVAAPGYYLLTFSKPGYQTKKYVVDSSAAAAKKPLAVELEPGDGSLSGRIAGPAGAVGGAKIVISDGTSTITASSNTKGDVGAWSVTGLSTPATYVVQATSDGLSMEARAVNLPAGGHSRVDLRLRNGVATLTGLVKAPASTGAVVGAGGVTVTVSGADGLVRTASTLTRAGQLGHYIVPALPAPGEYVVSITGDGYLTRTSQLTLKKGQSAATLDATLASAAGVVQGVVTDESTRAGLADAGLTLTNDEHTYKTMTTSAQPGRFRINGVAAGTYVLTTQLFGYGISQLTIEVEPGETVTANPTAATVDGGVLPATSSIVGSVMDANTRRPVECPSSDTSCLQAVVEDPATGDGKASAATYTTAFSPTESYTLPSDPDHGLRPGVHKVTVSALGYERTSVSVEVPAAARVTAPTVELYPAPVFRGTVRMNFEANGPTCVWAVQNGFTDTLPDCADAVDDGVCATSGVGSYDIAELDPQAVCAAVTGQGGDYSLTVPVHGSYLLHVEPSDPEFTGPPDTTYTLGLGQIYSLDVPLTRLGRLQLLAMTPVADGTLGPAVGYKVTVQPPPGGANPIPDGATTSSQGIVEIHGFHAGSYQVTASDPDDPTVSATKSIYISENTVTSATISLTNPIGSIVGQVVWSHDNTLEPVQGATVTGLFPAFYFMDTILLPELRTAVTQNGGCWGIASARTPVPTAAQCGSDPLTGAALAVGPTLSTIATALSVTAPGFTSWSQSSYTLQGWDAQDQTPVNQIVLTPEPIAFAASMTARPTTVDWGTVTVTAARSGANASRFSMSVDAGGNLHFTDDTIHIQDQIVPDTYTITASAPGYNDATGTLDCLPAGTCQWVGDAPELTGLGAIHGTLVGVIGHESEDSPVDQLAGVTVHAQLCSDDDCTAVKGRDYTGVTDSAGAFSIAGSGGTGTLPAGDYRLTAATSGFHAVGDPKTVTVGIGDDVDAGALRLWIDTATLTVELVDDVGDPVTGPAVDLLIGSSLVQAGTADGSTYTFTDVVPNAYTLQATGSTLRPQFRDIVVQRARSSQEATFQVTIGAVVLGQVKGADGTATVPVDDATVSLLCTVKQAPICDAVGAVADDAGGDPLTVQTGENGSFRIRNVPDGSFAVRVEAEGWVTQTTAAIGFDHLVGTIPNVPVTLQPVTHPVELTVSPSVASDPLTGAVVKLTKGSVTLTASSWTKSGSDWVATFTQVPTGCWTPALTLADHYGNLGDVDPTECDDPEQLWVDPVDDGDTVEAETALSEAPLTVDLTTTAAVPHAGLPDGAEASIHVTAGEVTYDGAGPMTVWLPAGTSYSASAKVTPGSVFWPATGPKTGSVDATGKTVALTITERTQLVTVTVQAAGAGVTVTATDADSGTVTGTTAANGKVTLALPAGTWSLAATGGTTDHVTEDYEVTDLSPGSVMLAKVPDPEPTPDPTPTDPTPTDPTDPTDPTP